MNCEVEVNEGCTTGGVLLEVLAERKRQDERWGQQNHPWDNYAEHVVRWGFVVFEDQAKQLVDWLGKKDLIDYAGILTEEYLEAVNADSIERVREELIQVAAVAVAAVESIDRNGR